MKCPVIAGVLAGASLGAKVALHSARVAPAPVSLLTVSEGAFSETGLPINSILGN